MNDQVKILSYCLFHPRKRENREWDKYQDIDNRYFVNLPFLLITKEVLFPCYKIVFHVDQTNSRNPLFEFIRIASTIDNSIEIKVLKNTNKNDFAPTSWRMAPFFDERTDLLYCRDIDSLTTSKEFKTMMYFENSEYKMYTNRSHVPGHKSDRIKILAGLCGFKPKEIQLGISYEDFISEEHPLWIQDQIILEKFFYGLSKDEFLDVPTRKLSKIGVNEEKTSHWVDDLPIELSDYTDSNGIKYLEFLDSLTTWEGEPLDVRSHVNTFLSFGNESSNMIKGIFNDNKGIGAFYGK